MHHLTQRSPTRDWSIRIGPSVEAVTAPATLGQLHSDIRLRHQVWIRIQDHQRRPCASGSRVTPRPNRRRASRTSALENDLPRARATGSPWWEKRFKASTGTRSSDRSTKPFIGSVFRSAIAQLDTGIRSPGGLVPLGVRLQVSVGGCGTNEGSPCGVLKAFGPHALSLGQLFQGRRVPPYPSLEHAR
jgi:hypothetical protein